MYPVSIARQSYTVAYAVGPAAGDYCAAMTIGAGGQVISQTAVSLGITVIGTNTLVISYAVLAGYQPHANGNWAGLWKGQVDAFAPGTPVKTALVAGNADQGEIPFNSITLEIDTTYTVVYFMSSVATSAAAQLVFSTASPGGTTTTPAAPAAEKELTWRFRS